MVIDDPNPVPVPWQQVNPLYQDQVIRSLREQAKSLRAAQMLDRAQAFESAAAFLLRYQV